MDIPIYYFSSHLRRRKTRRVEPKPVIIVDGILVLAESDLRECLDLRIFVSTDDDIRPRLQGLLEPSSPEQAVSSGSDG